MEPAVLPRPVGHTRPIRVLVVDDNAGFRESLLSLLEAGNLQVVGEAGSGVEALGLVRSLAPDVVLMDVRMPTMDGIEATRRLKADFPDLGVVALSGHEDQEIVRGMLVAGASGYVLKDSDGDEILTAVSRAAQGGALLSSGVTSHVIEELTRRSNASAGVRGSWRSARTRSSSVRRDGNSSSPGCPTSSGRPSR